jgi:hypothetical protein
MRIPPTYPLLLALLAAPLPLTGCANDADIEVESDAGPVAPDSTFGLDADDGRGDDDGTADRGRGGRNGDDGRHSGDDDGTADQGHGDNGTEDNGDDGRGRNRGRGSDDRP